MSETGTTEAQSKEEGWVGSLMPAAGSAEHAALQPLIDRIKQAGESSRAMRQLQFEALPPQPGGVVFLGDSITEGGLWAEWFSGVPSSNRGIGGDTVQGVSSRLDSALRSPTLVSLLIGTNDLSSWDAVGDVDKISDDVSVLLSRIRSAAPSTGLLLNGVMPRTPELADPITRLNRRYRELADDFGATYIDTWDALVDSDGSIRPDCSLDSLHLTGEGYRRWVELLRPHVASAMETTVAA